MHWWRFGKRKPTAFEQAYMDLYNDRISADHFHIAAGIQDKQQAWHQLTEYRQRVMHGQIDDPRDKYNQWR